MRAKATAKEREILVAARFKETPWSTFESAILSGWTLVKNTHQDWTLFHPAGFFAGHLDGLLEKIERKFEQEARYVLVARQRLFAEVLN